MEFWALVGGQGGGEGEGVGVGEMEMTGRDGTGSWGTGAGFEQLLWDGALEVLWAPLGSWGGVVEVGVDIFSCEVWWGVGGRRSGCRGVFGCLLCALF